MMEDSPTVSGIVAAKNKLKLVVVGDSFCGKTSLLFAYTKKQFLDNYNTTVFDNWSVTVDIDQRSYDVNLFDTAGQEDYEHIRCLSYPHTNVFIICFSLIDRKSLESCRSTWMPEIRKYAGENVPVLLVGTKSDLMEDYSSNPKHEIVTEDQARKMANEIGCIKYLGCSSLTHKGLKQVFDESFLVGVGVKIDTNEPEPCCLIL
ncbi:unnamed protein product [Caenorhabditis angaria]|uniref:Uncharacterized protein n=1 Tax=Caenorhabditis angaria TaxID=860376 RepID=A0A9P1J0V5_9PELO|nr:unnamed protein product [Caenorhabditis angaria]